jgi:hypothetical protein
VRPNDKKQTFEIFRTNTCLWGGKYNPIIPFFNRIPQWWERRRHRFENAKQIINGYLDFFEPDFIVEAEKGIASTLDFDQKRVIQLSNILVRDGDRHKEGHGLSVFNLYKELYHKEFKFVHRVKQKIVNVTPEDKNIELFSACVFGAFPQQKLEVF